MLSIIDECLDAAAFDFYKGMRIVESPLVVPIPVLSISPIFPWCSDECRREMDAWLLDMFGKKEVAYIINNDTMLVSPARAFRLRLEREYNASKLQFNPFQGSLI